MAKFFVQFSSPGRSSVVTSDHPPAGNSELHAEFLRLFLNAQPDIYRYVCALLPQPQDAADLRARLRDKPAARAYFNEVVALHAALAAGGSRAAGSIMVDRGPAAEFPQAGRARFLRFPALAWLGAAAALIAVSLVM